MSVIVGVEGDNIVALATDSEEQTAGIHVHGITKAVQVGPCWVGYTGISLWDRFLRWVNHEKLCANAWDLGTASKPQDPDGAVWVNTDPPVGPQWYWWTCALADAQHEWAKERGHGAVNEAAHYHNSGFVCATPGGLYTIDASGTVRQRPWFADGCGIQVATGALWALEQWSPFTAQKTAIEAVRAAIAHAPGCGGEALIYVVERDQ